MNLDTSLEADLSKRDVHVDRGFPAEDLEALGIDHGNDLLRVGRQDRVLQVDVDLPERIIEPNVRVHNLDVELDVIEIVNIVPRESLAVHGVARPGLLRRLLGAVVLVETNTVLLQRELDVPVSRERRGRSEKEKNWLANSVGSSNKRKYGRVAKQGANELYDRFEAVVPTDTRVEGRER
jgi:hypothetical protein